MIIRSEDKVQVGGKNKPVWVLDTDALTVTYNTPDAEPSVTTFSSDHIKYHLHYSAEYRPARKVSRPLSEFSLQPCCAPLPRSTRPASHPLLHP